MRLSPADPLMHEFQTTLGAAYLFMRDWEPAISWCRRAIANNAVLINDVRVTSDKVVIGEADVTPEGVIKLSLGRKRHVLLKPV